MRPLDASRGYLIISQKLFARGPPGNAGLPRGFLGLGHFRAMPESRHCVQVRDPRGYVLPRALKAKGDQFVACARTRDKRDHKWAPIVFKVSRSRAGNGLVKCDHILPLAINALSRMFSRALARAFGVFNVRDFRQYMIARSR